MATHRQGQPQQKNNGGVPDQLQNVSQRVQDGASAIGDRVQEGYDAAREHLTHSYRQAEGAIARNPTSSVAVGFGIGFGLGVLLTVLLSRREETWAERAGHYIPDSLRNVPDRLRNLHLAEAVARHLPGH